LENRLKSLYQLQKIDIQLDELEELRGDLPSQVAELEAKVSEAENKTIELEEEIQEILSKRNRIDDEVQTLKQKSEKYKSQLYSVKTNKEYDALTKEIDGSELKSLELSEEMDKLADKQKKIREDLEEFEKTFKKSQKELDEKQKELEVILKTTEKEELELNHQKDKVLVKINKKDIAIYTKIRNAKGVAIVPAKKGACGGCYNIVPPQRLVELRKNEKLHMCEFCGRILISEELLG
jgi:uncharacterized protein